MIAPITAVINPINDAIIVESNLHSPELTIHFKHNFMPSAQRLALPAAGERKARKQKTVKAQNQLQKTRRSDKGALVDHTYPDGSFGTPRSVPGGGAVLGGYWKGS